jgi:hypothetical protein
MKAFSPLRQPGSGSIHPASTPRRVNCCLDWHALCYADRNKVIVIIFSLRLSIGKDIIRIQNAIDSYELEFLERAGLSETSEGLFMPLLNSTRIMLPNNISGTI